MSRYSGTTLLLLAGSVVWCAAAAQETSKKTLTARELFYSAVQSPAAAPKAAEAKPAAKPAQPVAVARTDSKAKKTEVAVKPPSPPAPVEKSPAPAAQNARAARPAAPALPDGGRIVQAAITSAPAPSGPPLGLKYTILKRVGDAMVETAPDAVFRAGDRIQISVEPNGPGFLYIVNQGSSGTWKPMFPSPEVEDGNNHVEGWLTYVMPPRSRIVFDEQTGVEKLFIILSREPEADLEKMIYSLSGGPKPVAAPDEPRQPKQMLVAANMAIDDSFVGRMRNTYARDLVIEKVDENSPGEKKEKAVYVVNPTGSSDSRVVADLSLVHE